MNTTNQDTSLSRAFDDQRYAWTRTQRVRRRLVAAEATLLTALTAGVLFASTAPGGPTGTYFLVLALGLCCFLPLHSMLNLGIRGLFDRGTGSLDEHQQRVRDRSTSAMRWGNAGLTLAAWFGGIMLGAATGHTVLALYLGFLLWFVAGLLAYWHLAWTLPDEVIDPDPFA